MPHILVTGGAGYIGSHTALALTEAGFDVTVADNLSTGFSKAVLPPAKFVQLDLADRDFLNRFLSQVRFDAIIHFAASIVVPESVQKPLPYYRNNTANTLQLVESAVAHGIGNLVFSSTAAVYGEPSASPVSENTPLHPVNPYGRSKLADEWIIADTAHAHDTFRHVSLRYFNVAGADPLGRLGQSTPEATHLIKVACQAALGRRDKLFIFGTDYPTPDGTGVRDYIHVTDLADVHVLALRHLLDGGVSLTMNCGYGHGESVRDIVETVRKVSGRSFGVAETGRRPGDPAELVADPSLLKRTLSWRPAHDDLEEIVATALRWEEHPRFP